MKRRHAAFSERTPGGEAGTVDCIFCSIKDYVFENDLAYAIFDKTPVNDGHMLIITKRHAADFFEITKEERDAIFDLIERCRDLIDKKFKPDGYNIGVNCGESAGQSVMHVHMHLIPRYKGDTASSHGGVRAVVPERMRYGTGQ